MQQPEVGPKKLAAMVLFVDTEWADVLASELVSLALVSDCGRFEFYAERDPLPAVPTDFVRSVVYPLLQRGHHACSDAEFTRRLHAFFASVAGVARHGRVTVAYDHHNDLDLLNYVLDGFEEVSKPERPALRAYNLGWLGDGYLAAVEECFASDPELQQRRHHALTDAKVNRDVYLRLKPPAATGFPRLASADPEFAARIVEVLGGTEKAAAWWTTRSRLLGMSPSQAHAERKMQEVLDELHAIRHGFPF